MARPRKLRNPIVVPLVLERELYEAAKMVAKAKGVSVSQLVRKMLKQYLEEEAVKLGIQIVFTDERKVGERKSARAILMQKKLTKLRREMRELEGQVEELEAYVNALKRIKSNYVYDGGGLVGKEELLRRVRERLKSLQKWVTSLEKLCIMLEQTGHDVVEEAKRLVALEERIDALWERV